MNKPLPQQQLDRLLKEMDIQDLSKTTIRQCTALGSALEQEAGEPFTHLEIGVPGIAACPYGIEAQKKALDSGIASIYPVINGLPPLMLTSQSIV